MRHLRLLSGLECPSCGESLDEHLRQYFAALTLQQAVRSRAACALSSRKLGAILVLQAAVRGHAARRARARVLIPEWFFNRALHAWGAYVKRLLARQKLLVHANYRQLTNYFDLWSQLRACVTASTLSEMLARYALLIRAVEQHHSIVVRKKAVRISAGARWLHALDTYWERELAAFSRYPWSRDVVRLVDAKAGAREPADAVRPALRVYLEELEGFFELPPDQEAELSGALLEVFEADEEDAAAGTEARRAADCARVRELLARYPGAPCNLLYGESLVGHALWYDVDEPPQMLNTVLAAGADPNAADEGDGTTPLGCGALFCEETGRDFHYKAKLTLLLAYGATDAVGPAAEEALAARELLLVASEENKSAHPEAAALAALSTLPPC